MRGFDTGNDQAKSEMQEFMTNEIPDLRVDIQLTIAEGDKVACLMEYRGTHATFKREAIWREIWGRAPRRRQDRRELAPFPTWMPT